MYAAANARVFLKITGSHVDAPERAFVARVFAYNFAPQKGTKHTKFDIMAAWLFTPTFRRRIFNAHNIETG
jgi:hypothetical protein